jgi:hypothetical protein
MFKDLKVPAVSGRDNYPGVTVSLFRIVTICILDEVANTDQQERKNAVFAAKISIKNMVNDKPAGT